MASYADLLRGVNDRLGYNADDPDRQDNNVDWKLSFSAKPKKAIDLTMEKKVEQEVKNDAVSQVEKTSSKLKINHGDCTTTYGFANDKMSFNGKGKAVDDDSWRVDITGAAEVKQAKKAWKVTGTLDVKAKDLGGAKAVLNTDVEYNEKSETMVKPRVNVEISDEINVGASAKWDTKEFKEIWPQFVYKPKDCSLGGFYWARADVTRSLLMLGCNQQLKDSISHSFEAVYGWAGYEGIQGNPVSLRAGVEYDLSDQTQVTASGEWAKSYSVSQEVTHKIDSHWTVAATQSFDSEKVGGKVSPYHIGFSASYKL